MGLINNGQIPNAFTQDFILQPTVSQVPNSNADFIQPTYDFANTRYCNVVISNVNLGTGNVILYTTPTDVDFYLSSCSLGVLKTSTDAGTSSTLNIVVMGVTTSILEIPGITLTAMENTTSLALPIPIKVDRGTQILLTGTGISKSFASIAGFTKVFK